MTLTAAPDDASLPAPAHLEEATLAGGCFWCLDAVFSRLEGVAAVECGYSNGAHPQPTYERVCSGTTGHAEVVRLRFDPRVTSYRDVLGVPMEPWGGAALRYDASDHPPVVVWNAFPEAGGYMAPSTREFMINFAVDDLDAVLARLKTKGVTPLKRDDSDPSGKFAWILDPDGTKIELPRK